MSQIQSVITVRKPEIVNGKCHRLGCNGNGTNGVRADDGKVILFCRDCWHELLKSRIIDRRTGQVTTS